jgi:putative alpha-1,2-mannosidase
VKLGISFVSSARAEKNVHTEAPHWDFDHTRRRAQDVWREHLTRITPDLRGLPTVARKEFFDRELTHFYSALYRCHLMPSDRTGEDPKAPHSTAS